MKELEVVPRTEVTADDALRPVMLQLSGGCLLVFEYPQAVSLETHSRLLAQLEAAIHAVEPTAKVVLLDGGLTLAACMEAQIAV